MQPSFEQRGNLVLHLFVHIPLTNKYHYLKSLI